MDFLKVDFSFLQTRSFWSVCISFAVAHYILGDMLLMLGISLTLQKLYLSSNFFYFLLLYAVPLGFKVSLLHYILKPNIAKLEERQNIAQVWAVAVSIFVVHSLFLSFLEVFLLQTVYAKYNLNAYNVFFHNAGLTFYAERFLQFCFYTFPVAYLCQNQHIFKQKTLEPKDRSILMLVAVGIGYYVFFLNFWWAHLIEGLCGGCVVYFFFFCEAVGEKN